MNWRAFVGGVRGEIGRQFFRGGSQELATSLLSGSLISQEPQIADAPRLETHVRCGSRSRNTGGSRGRLDRCNGAGGSDDNARAGDCAAGWSRFAERGLRTGRLWK